MIRGIRRRFIRIALGVLALAMVLVAGAINVANWVSVRAELSETMTALCQSGPQRGKFGGRSRHMRNVLDESRYYMGSLTSGGTWELDRESPAFQWQETDSADIAGVAEKVLSTGRESGFYGDYMYAVTDRRTGAVVLLNCETRLTRVRWLLVISAVACVGCVLLAWLLVSLFSRRAIRPLVENAIQQKQFITDAGHELKTPLTVISANMDVLALETGGNEWIRSTKKQVASMRALVGELIYLSRLDEEDAKLKREDVDLSDLVRNTVEPFVAMAEFKGRQLTVDAGDAIHVTGDAAALGRLVSILCDNAVKYAPEGDTIAIALRRGRKGVVLTSENGLSAPLSPDALNHLFDRFYRVDASRSRETGGNGIGLSVAKAIAERHGGRLTAALCADGARIRFTCRLHA